MRRFSAILVLLAAAASSFAADSAQEIVKKAAEKAALQGKNVLVVFTASWCGWCHRLDDFLEKTAPGAKVKSALEVVHITVLESKEKAAEETPGGLDLLKTLHGAGTGIPYFAIVDAKGKVLAVSNPNKDKEKPGNIGYPASKEEIAHFMQMLKAGAPKLNAADLAEIEKWLKDNAPKG